MIMMTMRSGLRYGDDNGNIAPRDPLSAGYVKAGHLWTWLDERTTTGGRGVVCGCLVAMGRGGQPWTNRKLV